jgi:deoxyuridine 5'-triphosphate nucleotidohydrolase
MIKIKKLTKTAKTPIKAHESDAGYDLFSDQEVIIPKKSRKTISTGISIQLPNIGSNFEDLYIRIAPKSGLATKQGIDVLAGVVDRGYSGEIKVCLFNSSDKDVKIEKEQKIAQMIPTIIFKDKLVEVEELDKTKRGDNGFGSTGK